MENKFMRVEEVAAELGVSASYAYIPSTFYAKRSTFPAERITIASGERDS